MSPSVLNDVDWPMLACCPSTAVGMDEKGCRA
jgi:hypothetical protein